MKTHETIEKHDGREGWIGRKIGQPYWSEVSICTTKIPMSEAALAMEIAKHVSIAICVPDNEDSAGRQKFGLMPPEQVSKRACDIAELMWAEFDARGWLLDVPLPQLVTPEKKDKEETA